MCIYLLLFFSLTARIREQKYRTTEQGFESVQCGERVGPLGAGADTHQLLLLHCSYIYHHCCPGFMINKLSSTYCCSLLRRDVNVSFFCERTFCFFVVPWKKNSFRFVFVFEFKEKKRFVYLVLIKSLFLFLNVLFCFIV